MTSRERVAAAINHIETDQVPLDIGATHNSGIHAYALQALREHMNLNRTPVKIFDPMLMTGIIEEDMIAALSADCIALDNPFTLLGYDNCNWKPWEAPNGMTFLVGEKFEYTLRPDGVYLYPRGDRTSPPSAKMTLAQPYFDSIVRQVPLDEDDMDAHRDYADDMTLLSEQQLRYYEETVTRLFRNTELAIVGSYYGGGLGDMIHIQAPSLAAPKGIRDMSEWMMAPYLYPEYVRETFAMQTECVIENLKLYHQAVGEKICCIAIAGTDFGSQRGLLYSKDIYREFYKPYFKRINEWVHHNTTWKTWYHSCGSVHELFGDFIEAGYDIINPVQTTAEGMDPIMLKKKYGDRLVFWGGSADPQEVLPFGTPEQVEQQVSQNIKIFKKDGGYVCSPIHNITAEVPPENILALCRAAKMQKSAFGN